jgi:putative hemolysin
MEITADFLNIERVIASKNPRLAKALPKFIIRYLKRILHQDDLNGYIYRNRDKFGLDFVEAILGEFGVITEVADSKGAAADITSLVPAGRRLMIVSNHPLGGLDGMALIHAVGRARPELVFPVNDLLMNVPGLQPLFIPINKHGKNTDNIRIIEDTFASDKTILYFPAGLVSRKQGGGVIMDLEWHKTFISKAKRSQRDILPVYISGRNSEFFYNLARWRQRLGIEANIEMLYLVDEMIRQRGKTIRMIFGEVIYVSTFDKTKTDRQWAAWVKDIVYGMSAR